MRQEAKPVSAVRYFLKHVVAILFRFRKGAEVKRFAITSFVFSVYDNWLLMTAGHCIADVQAMIELGYTLESTALIDSMHAGAKHQGRVPFEYRDATPIKLSDHEDLDYGLIFVRPLYRQLLEANGVEPLDETVWDAEPPRVDKYLLLGFPAEMANMERETVRIGSTLHLVEKLEQRPEEFYMDDPEAPLFYGRLKFLEPISDIQGVSGGPILALHRLGPDDERYWLVAMQSKWIKSERLIKAVLIKPLGDFLKDVVERNQPAREAEQGAEQVKS